MAGVRHPPAKQRAGISFTQDTLSFFSHGHLTFPCIVLPTLPTPPHVIHCTLCFMHNRQSFSRKPQIPAVPEPSTLNDYPASILFVV